VPLNDSFTFARRRLCASCTEQAVNSAGELPEGSVVRNTDPTVCANCGKDAGERQLPQLMSVPLCNRCMAFFRNRPFPGWIRLAFVGLIAIVVFSLMWNARFMLAYKELRALGKATAAGAFDEAAALAASAADRVPECADLRHLAQFYEGVSLLHADKCAEALEKLEACKPGVPPEWRVDRMILHARMGVAFDKGDYDGFLAEAQKVLQANPNDAMSSATVASAYACKFAATGEEAFRQKSLEFLEQARSKPPNEELPDYEVRIRHRLHTREIITRKQFAERYPGGWKPDKPEKGSQEQQP